MTVPFAPEWFRRAGFDVQEFSANGVRTFAVVEGRREHFPVIFLHGFPGGAFVWEYVIAALGRKRLAIAPDFPGWGRSLSRFGVELPSPSLQWSMAWLNGLLAAQHIERLDLVAHGSGTWLALELLAQDPLRVRRLALLSLPLRHEGFTPGSAVGRLFGYRMRWTPQRMRRWLNEHAAFADSTRERSTKQFAQLERRDHAPEIMAAAADRMTVANDGRALHEFRGRSLLIWGERDPAYSAHASEEFAANMDRPQVHRLTQSGHYPMLDDPQVVTAYLSEFLED
jgi:pimeloyl-ACP methyl ester carboxylesterase